MWNFVFGFIGACLGCLTNFAIVEYWRARRAALPQTGWQHDPDGDKHFNGQFISSIMRVGSTESEGKRVVVVMMQDGKEEHEPLVCRFWNDVEVESMVIALRHAATETWPLCPICNETECCCDAED